MAPPAYASAAASGQRTVATKRRVPAGGPKTKTFSPEQRCFELNRDPSLPPTIGRNGTAEDQARRIASVQAAINKRLHQRRATARVKDLFLTKSGKYWGSTRATNSAHHLLEHRNEAIQAARTADLSATGQEARTAWWWIKAHPISVVRYLGKGSSGTDALREEPEVENEGLKIPSTVR